MFITHTDYQAIKHMVIKFRNKYLTSTATKIHLLAITANYLRKESN